MQLINNRMIKMNNKFLRGCLFSAMFVYSGSSYSHGGPTDFQVLAELQSFHRTFRNEFMNGVYRTNIIEIKLLLNKIIEGIRLSALAITENAKENTKSQMENAVRVQSDSDRIEAEFQYEVTDPCFIGATAGISDVYQAVAVTSGAVGRGGSTSGSSGKSISPGKQNSVGSAKTQMEKVNDIANGVSKAPAPEVTAAAAASSSCGSFSGNDAIRRAACVAADFFTGVIGGFSNADISAKTLMDGPQKTGDEKKRFTVKTTPNRDSDEEVAVAAYMRNLGVPFDLRSLEPGELRTAAGRRYMAIKDTFDARMSMAQRPMSRHVGMMAQNTKSQEMKAAVLDMIKDDPTVKTRLDASFKDWSNGISLDELMNADVERRYSSIEWLKKTTTESEKWLAGEQARIAAQQSLLLWRLNQESRETNVLLGAIAGSLTRSEMMAEMKAAHNAATR